MTNEEIIDKTRGTELWQYYGEEVNKLLDLARADEREKMTEEKVREYLGGFNGKESALIVLNYLLRGNITDDDLRGVRLQWITDEREKMQTEIGHLEYKIEGLQQALSRNKDEREKCLKILAGKMFELQFMFNKVYEKTYQDRETLTLPEIQQRIADIADVMQRVRGESEQSNQLTTEAT